MGSQNSTLQAKKRNYFSVEYLNENNHDLDFTRNENFAHINFPSLLKHEQITSKSSRNLEKDEKLSNSDLSFEYETLDGSRNISNLMKMNSKSSQNLVGLVRNGGVLVQRSKSYVRSENKVLPSNFTTKPLKETHLLRTVGMNRTWRNHNRTSIYNPAVFDQMKQKTNSINDLRYLNGEEGILKLSKSKPDLNSQFKDSINDKTVTELLKKKNGSLENNLSNRNDSKTVRSASSKLSSWSMLVKKRKNLDLTASQVLSNNKENLSNESKTIKPKIGKSRSFLHQIKTYKMSSTNSQHSNNSNNRKLENQSKIDKKIQIISGFPINSKVYRHYIAGNGNKSDKLTNSIDISNIMRNRKSFSKKIGSFRQNKHSVTNKKIKSDEQEQIPVNLQTDQDDAILQERGIDVNSIYDMIYDEKNEIKSNESPSSIPEIEHFYFDNESIDNDHLLSSNNCPNITMKPLDDSNISRPASIILTEDVRRTNDLIKSCKKILEESNELDYEYLTEFFQKSILNKSSRNVTNKKISSGSLHSSDNQSESSSEQKDSSIPQINRDSFIPEFYLQSSKVDFEMFPNISANESETKNLNDIPKKPQIKQRKSLRTIEGENTSKNTNFILKPKGNSPILRSKSIPDSINNPCLDSIDLTKKSPHTKPKKEPNTVKNKRKGLSEIFPNINLEREINTRLSIKDPNWCPATDLYEFDLDGSIDPIESSKNKNECVNKNLVNIFDNNSPIRERIMIFDRSGETNEGLCFQSKDRDILKHQPFTQLNLLY